MKDRSNNQIEKMRCLKIMQQVNTFNNRECRREDSNRANVGFQKVCRVLDQKPLKGFTNTTIIKLK